MRSVVAGRRKWRFSFCLEKETPGGTVGIPARPGWEAQRWCRVEGCKASVRPRCAPCALSAAPARPGGGELKRSGVRFKTRFYSFGFLGGKKKEREEMEEAGRAEMALMGGFFSSWICWCVCEKESVLMEELRAWKCPSFVCQSHAVLLSLLNPCVLCGSVSLLCGAPRLSQLLLSSSSRDAACSHCCVCSTEMWFLLPVLLCSFSSGVLQSFSAPRISCCSGLCVYPLCYYCCFPAVGDSDQVALKILSDVPEMGNQRRAEAVLLGLLPSSVHLNFGFRFCSDVSFSCLIPFQPTALVWIPVCAVNIASPLFSPLFILTAPNEVTWATLRGTLHSSCFYICTSLRHVWSL